jgi:hypothetical protein
MKKKMKRQKITCQLTRIQLLGPFAVYISRKCQFPSENERNPLPPLFNQWLQWQRQNAFCPMGKNDHSSAADLWWDAIIKLKWGRKLKEKWVLERWASKKEREQKVRNCSQCRIPSEWREQRVVRDHTTRTETQSRAERVCRRSSRLFFLSFWLHPVHLQTHTQYTYTQLRPKASFYFS